MTWTTTDGRATAKHSMTTATGKDKTWRRATGEPTVEISARPCYCKATEPTIPKGDDMSDTTTHTAYQLARLAECMDPDSHDSPGARFLARVADDYREAVTDGWYDADDGPHEIADAAVPVYTHELWTTFTDLGAYQEDPTELGEDGTDMTRAAGVCLYIIAVRLVRALHDERDDDDTDDEDDDA